MYYNLEFEHYGVKGMKWGRRKASQEPRKGDRYRKSKIAATTDREIYGKGGVKRIAKSLDKGYTAKGARNKEFVRSIGMAGVQAALLGGASLAVADLAMTGGKGIIGFGRLATTAALRAAGHTDIRWSS